MTVIRRRTELELTNATHTAATQAIAGRRRELRGTARESLGAAHERPGCLATTSEQILKIDIKFHVSELILDVFFFTFQILLLGPIFRAGRSL